MCCNRPKKSVLLTNISNLFWYICPYIRNIPHRQKRVKARPFFSFLNIRFIGKTVVMRNSSQEHLNTNDKILQWEGLLINPSELEKKNSSLCFFYDWLDCSCLEILASGTFQWEGGYSCQDSESYRYYMHTGVSRCLTASSRYSASSSSTMNSCKKQKDFQQKCLPGGHSFSPRHGRRNVKHNTHFRWLAET